MSCPSKKKENAETIAHIFYQFNEQLDPWGTQRPFHGIS